MPTITKIRKEVEVLANDLRERPVEGTISIACGTLHQVSEKFYNDDQYVTESAFIDELGSRTIEQVIFSLLDETLVSAVKILT